MSPHRRARWIIAVPALAAVAACSDSAPMAPAPETAEMSAQAQDRLSAVFNRAYPEVLAIPGTVFADHDEVGSKLVFGVENEGVGRSVQARLTRMGVARADYEVRVTEPIHQLATLRDRWRPTRGGIQIHFSNYLCTLGFNVSHAGGRSFITNSHCTAKQGGTEGTVYYQPTSSVDGTVIGTEAADPAYFRNTSPCPRGRLCRWSDAARVLYSSSVSSTQGDIAKTSAVNNGSIEVTGTFSVTSQDISTARFPIGLVVNKVGRTTGWSQGQVTNTCVHTNVSGSNITQLCQTFVSAAVGGGDSGSPVFRITSGDNVQLVGILWGGSSNGASFVFSPLKQVIQELGSMTATK